MMIYICNVDSDKARSYSTEDGYAWEIEGKSLPLKIHIYRRSSAGRYVREAKIYTAETVTVRYFEG